MYLSKIIPDIEFQDSSNANDTVNLVLKGRSYPNEAQSTLSTSALTLNVSVNSCISSDNLLMLDSKLKPTFGDDDMLVKTSGVIGDSNERSFKYTL